MSPAISPSSRPCMAWPLLTSTHIAHFPLPPALLRQSSPFLPLGLCTPCVPSAWHFHVIGSQRMCHHLQEAFPGHATVAFTSRCASHPLAQCLHMAYPSHLFKLLSPSLRQEPQELCSLLPPNTYHTALSSARAVETLVHGMNAQRACLGPL